jgi:integrase
MTIGPAERRSDLPSASQSDRRPTHQRVSRSGKPYEQRPRAKANREGTIYQRKDTGTWCAAITLDNGKRQYLYGATREEVGQKLTRALVDRQNGIAPANQRETVASWLSQYLDDLEARGAPQSTISRYRGIFVNYLLPFLGKHKLAQLQPQHVQAYQTTLLKRDFSASSITVHRAVLSGALKQAVSFGLLPRNVVPLVKRPRESRDNKGAALTPAAGRAFLDAIRGDRYEAFYLVLLTAGLRRSEGLGLQWADLDIDGPDPSVRVRQQLQWPKGVPTLVPVKSRKGVRSVPLPSVTAAALRERRSAQQRERMLLGEADWRAGNLVFNTEEGGSVHRSTIARRFHERLKAAGIAPMRLHDLRHTYGSLLMSQGVPLKMISELMGHASIEVTANVYLHTLDVQVRDTARSVERALAGRSEFVGPARRCEACGQPLPESGRASSGEQAWAPRV